MPIDDTKQFTIGIGNQRMKKWSVIYGSRLSNATDTELRFLAEHFDLIDCNPYMTSQPYNAQKLATLKQYAAQYYNNPNIKGIGYHYYCSSKTSTFPEDWYVHYDGYTDSAHRVYETGEGGSSYFMNPKPNLTVYQGHHGWRDYYAQMCYNANYNYPQYDGVFDDNVYNSLYWIDALFGNINVKTSRWNDENGDYYTETNWGNWTFDCLAYQQSILNTLPGTKISMMNCGYMGESMTPATNWMCFEHFIHSCRASYLSYWGGTEGGYEWGVRWVNLVHTIQKNGGYTGLLSGCAMDAGYTDWLLYCYCCGLLACVDLEHTYYAWNFYGDDTNNGYLPLMDTVIGQPITSWGTATDIRDTVMELYSHPDDPYGFPYHGGVFAREFENYWVVVNFAGAVNGQPVLPKYNYTWTDPDGGAHVIPGKRALLWQK